MSDYTGLLTDCLGNLTGNSYFPKPKPPLSEISVMTNDLEVAYQLSFHIIGATADVHAKLGTLVNSLNLLAAYVQKTANEDKEIAGTIINSAGMDVKKTGAKPPKAFNLRRGKNSDTVILNSKASRYRSAAYIYQISVNPRDPNSWTTIYTGTRVKFVYEGLIPGQVYYFRVGVSDKNGMGNWSEVLSI